MAFFSLTSFVYMLIHVYVSILNDIYAYLYPELLNI
jgi:hypothetical protein